MSKSNRKDYAKGGIDYHKAALLEALEDNYGIVARACQQVKITRDQYYAYYNEDPEFKKKADQTMEICLDLAEGKLIDKIQEGSEKSIHFFLKYRGKSRGYTDAVDITSNGKSISEIKLINVAEIKKED